MSSHCRMSYRFGAFPVSWSPVWWVSFGRSSARLRRSAGSFVETPMVDTSKAVLWSMRSATMKLSSSCPANSSRPTLSFEPRHLRPSSAAIAFVASS